MTKIYADSIKDIIRSATKVKPGDVLIYRGAVIYDARSKEQKEKEAQ